jgi:hypothetical protein
VIRGLLCFACNRGLGIFYDRPELFRAACHYLQLPRTGIYLGPTWVFANRAVRHRIDEEEYLKLHDQQNGRCAICHDDSLPLRVDHDHDTDEVRGLLCSPCNLVLGLFQDSPIILLAAAKYLELWIQKSEAATLSSSGSTSQPTNYPP